MELNDQAPVDEPATAQRVSWLRRERISLADVAVHTFAVVLGILLALLINGWNTKREQRATVDEAMHAIRAELAANRVGLHDHATQMFDMAAHMRESPANQNQAPRPCFQWDQFHGIGDLNLVDAAYQTSIATQALANMAFQQAQLVSQIYGWQRYREKGIDLDATLLFAHPEPLDVCAGIVEEAARGDMKLDAVYARLIGPDTAATPASPVSR